MEVKYFKEHILFLNNHRGYTEAEIPLFTRYTKKIKSVLDDNSVYIGRVFHSKPEDLSEYLTTWHNMNSMDPLWVFSKNPYRWTGHTVNCFKDIPSFWNDNSKLEDW